MKSGSETFLEALPWFAEEDYARIRSSMSDGPLLPATYSEWRRCAEAEEQEMLRLDVHPVRIPIVPKDFGAWCSHRALKPTESARRRFARETCTATGLNPP